MPAVSSLVQCHADALSAALAPNHPNREIHARHALNLAKILRAFSAIDSEEALVLQLRQSGLKTAPRTIRESAELLHDTALGVLHPSSWRARQVIPLEADETNERLAAVERALSALVASKGGSL